MRSGVVLVLALGACGFRSSPAADESTPPGDAVPRPDTPGATQDAALDGGSSLSSYCDPADSNLMACYEFEGNTSDGSSHRLDAVPVNVTYPTGKVGKAMLFGAISAATVAGSTVFDVTALTIEAWIQPTTLPAMGTQSDIIDVDKQYAFFLESDGRLSCDLHGLGTFTTPPATVAAGGWTHVACTYDGTTVAQIYIDGVIAGTHPGSGKLSTGGNPMSIAANNPSGSQLIGLIDQLRLMKVARTAAQICADAGKSGCQ